MNEKKVLIYRDYGCGDLNNLEKRLTEHFSPLDIAVDFTDSSAIIKDNALDDNVLLLVMPGGAATPYIQKLKTLGSDKIRNYVQNGGNYLGVCAGAYYACTKVEFETDVKPMSITRTQDLLNLVDASAVGTLHKELNIRPYMTNAASSAAVRLRWLNDDEICYAHYHGGPKFLPTKAGFEVLATYADIADCPPAIVAQNYGRGRVVLSGVHFENKGQDLAKAIHALRIDYQRAAEVAAELTEHEQSRQNLFRKIMSEFSR
ncbi:MAG: BPL-N domain-containing protein [Rhodospirillales bacterium]|nr:BPL-N domain-containing protein [Rhodospirillales bacterium]